MNCDLLVIPSLALGSRQDHWHQTLDGLLPHFPLDRWTAMQHLPLPVIHQLAVRYRQPVWEKIPQEAPRLLIHIPKNGGTSFARALYGTEVNHFPAFICWLTDQERFQVNRPIAFIRNPVDRFISAIAHHFGSPRASEADRQRAIELSRFGNNPLTIARNLAQREQLPTSLRSTLFFRPQISWITFRGLIIVDDLWSMDQMDNLLKSWGYPARRDNLTEGRPPTPIDPDLCQGLRKLYPADFQLWEAVRKRVI